MRFSPAGKYTVALQPLRLFSRPDDAARTIAPHNPRHLFSSAHNGNAVLPLQRAAMAWVCPSGKLGGPIGRARPGNEGSANPALNPAHGNKSPFSAVIRRPGRVSSASFCHYEIGGDGPCTAIDPPPYRNSGLSHARYIHVLVLPVLRSRAEKLSVVPFAP